MTVDEFKKLKKGTRVYWRGDAADSGIVTETSWDSVTIAWNNGQVASVHHGDMREIQRVPTSPPRGPTSPRCDKEPGQGRGTTPFAERWQFSRHSNKRICNGKEHDMPLVR